MEFNLNNLMLDDNAIEILPDGDYHFTVESHEVGYASSDKLPPNTQQITVHLSVPFEKDGEIHFAKVTNRFNVWQKALFALRNFAQCIGMMPERGRHAFDMDKLDGSTGVCAIDTRESSKGNTFNNVVTWYAPSKAPVVTANDEAWKKRDQVMITEVADELPDDIFGV